MYSSSLFISSLIISLMKLCSSQSNSMESVSDDSLDIDCASGFCSFLDHPPDAILTMPPPPLPLFMKDLLNDTNGSYFFDDGKCNFCEYFAEPTTEDQTFVAPRPTDKPADSMTSVIVASILGLSFGTLLLLMIWCKKWKIFPVKDSCPIFPESFFTGGGSKSSPPPSPSPCISPVVNEKSPQSTIITDSSRKTSIPSKYWSRRAGDYASHSQNLGIDSATDQYTEGSCTSSPVYAELDGPVVGLSASNSAVLISGQSPYSSALNTYSEIPETLRIGSSAGLLPDTSYDNATYLPTSNCNLYQSHSLRRSHHHQAKASPVDASLLHTDQMLMHAFPHVAYVTTRSNKKLRKDSMAQQLARNSIQRMQHDLTTIQQEGLILPASEVNSRQYASGTASRRSQGQVYMDLPSHSPNISTFKSAYGSYNSRNDSSKQRPLPPVPGVRL